MENSTISQKVMSREDRLIKIIKRSYGITEGDLEGHHKAKELLEAEAYHFECTIDQTAGTKNDISDTTTLSQLGLFTEVIGSGLSFSPSAGHVYLYSRKVQVTHFRSDGTKHVSDERRLSYYKQFRGKRRLCMLAGSIIGTSHIYVVREGDVFTHTHTNGVDDVTYTDLTNGVGLIKAGFIWITLPGGTKEFYKFFRSDMERLKGYSERSVGNANSLYSSGPEKDFDLGFFKNKVGSHALAKYEQDIVPSIFESDDIDADRSIVDGGTDTNADRPPETESPVLEKTKKSRSDIAILGDDMRPEVADKIKSDPLPLDIIPDESASQNTDTEGLW